ncbi:PRD domain-containing protein [Paenibacillus apiarius]|uniref:PRD domain-containing protein n=1 Tax=Paenibacillus apiarius TaxID=46240 RepID=A0ABT4E0N7_9BACL|nr:PRD domain-containing protein [Paenibacillus apiarius]MBN3524923.1 PRD domain-containing protein [Paenibacillus apiarius]MCY9516779.1 PRD domain-containing protein [Paenibacillus apiarius]MCY9523178.1 PRD domain-containing protein [Paenibacillus apiarius]MCY9553202.1 PRD domain-containing protein [Paenibacillus apiarius]MCY9559645.1 PRD domain-containing protein [Paenibacillus apiarius]
MSDKRRFEIIRSLSNNVVLANDVLTNKETILMGKGLGFGAKPRGELVPGDTRIEKTFALESQQHLSQYQMLLEQIDPEVITVSEQIISMVSETLTPDLNEHIHLALPSHIEYALYRLRHDIAIENPFLWEIRTLNPKEYELAAQAAGLIDRTFGVTVPEDEIGFLTIHIQSAVAHVPVGNMVQFNHLLKDLVALIEERRGSGIPKDSIDYLRLITHLRFAIERIRKGEHSRNPFRDKLKDMVPYEFEVAQDCAALMARQLKTEVTEDETAYIAMHLYRLFNKDE